VQLVAVRTARVIAHLNAEELNPSGRPLAHDFMKAFVERYKFIKYPQTPDEITDTEQKGLVFELGKWNDVGIDKLVLLDWGIITDTRASTESSEKVLQDMLNWGAETFGLSNRPDLITRRQYVSEIIFTSDMTLSIANARLNNLGNRVTESIARHFGQTLPYEINAIDFHFDTTQSKQFFAHLRIERFASAPFSDKKYYSGAPLPTEEHLRLIHDFEAALTA
jgi:hypothetical protein